MQKDLSSKKSAKKAYKKEKFVQEQSTLFTPTLDDEQKEVLQTILSNDITIITGKAGSGKTYVSCAAALQQLLQGKVETIILTRSTTSQDALGFLPGDLTDKYLPYLAPITSNFYKMYNKTHIDAFFANGKIQMVPLQFTRGISYSNAFVILDESQNLDIKQLKMCMSRLGEGSTLAICGDTQQIDFKKLSDSGLPRILDFKIPGLAVVEMYNEHRKQIVVDILNEFEKIGG